MCVCVCACVCVIVLQWNPSCEATPFASVMWLFKSGRNQYYYVWICIVKWTF